VGKVRTDPAMITVKIIGETAAVRSAVEAGAAAATRVGQLVSKHVIPRPADGMESIVFENTFLTDDEVRSILTGMEASPLEETADDAMEEEGQEYVPPTAGDREQYLEQIGTMTVHQLRSYARNVEGLGIYGRQISKANKDELIAELLKAKFGA
jgi:microcompartment protein CcmL/EutN